LSTKICNEPTMFLITSEETKRSNQEEDEFIIVNEKGEKVFVDSMEPSSKTMIHSKIYQQTDAECILHIHTIDNSIITKLYEDKKKVTLHSQQIYSILGVLDTNSTSVDIPIIEDVEELLELHQKNPAIHAVLVKEQGIIVWGKTIYETKQYLEMIEFLISQYVKLRMIQG